MTRHELTRQDIEVAERGSPDDLKAYINELRLDLVSERESARRLRVSLIQLLDEVADCKKGIGEMKS